MNNRDIIFTLKFRNQAAAVLSKFRTQLKSTGASAEKTNKRLRKLGRGFKRLADSAVRAGRRIKTAGTAIREAGTSITFALGAPLALAVKVSVKAFADFELALAGVQKTVNTTPEILKELKAEFLALSNEIPVAATELAAIGQIGGQLGVPVQDINTFTETVAKMSVSTVLDAEKAGIALARLSAIMGLPLSAANNLASSIVALGNNYAANEDEIAEFAKRIGRAGTIVGLSAGEVLGFSTALAELGIRAQAGGTAISRTLIRIANEVAEGGERLVELADVAGLSTEKFARLFKEDAAGALQQFIFGLNRAQKSGKNVFKILEDLGLQEIRVRDALISLTIGQKRFTEAVALGNKAYAENTALNREAAIFFDTVAKKMDVVKNQFQNAARALGESFKPQIEKIIEVLSTFALKLQEVADTINKLPTEMKETILWVVAFGIALGPVLIVLGTLLALLGFLVSAWGVFAGAVAIGIAALKRFAIAVATNPLTAWLVVIGLVAAALFKFRNEMIEFEGRTAALRDFIVAAWQLIKEQIEFVALFAVDLWNQAGLAISLIFSDIPEHADAAGKKMNQDADENLATFKNLFKAGANSVLGFFELMAIGISFAVEAGLTFIDNAIQNTSESFGNLVRAFKKAIVGDFAGAFDELFAPVKTGLFDGIPELAEEALGNIEKVFDPNRDVIGGVMGAWADRAVLVFNERTVKGMKKGNAAAEGVKAMTPGVVGATEDMAVAAIDTFASLWNKGLKKALNVYIKDAKDIAKLSQDAFTSAFQNIEDAMLDFIETGEFNWKEFTLSITREFNKIAIKSLLGDVLSKAKGDDISSTGFLAGLGDLLTGGASIEKRQGLVQSDLDSAFAASPGVFGAAGGVAGTAGDSAATAAVTAGLTALGATNTTGFTTVATTNTTTLTTLGTAITTGLTTLGTVITTAITAAAVPDAAAGAGEKIAGVIAGLNAGGGGVGTASEGGISDMLTKRVIAPIGAFANARKFAKGGVTSGRDTIPAMLAPNEAVIPLSRNRAVPIEGAVGNTTVNINVEAADVESFRRSESQTLARFGNKIVTARRKTM